MSAPWTMPQSGEPLVNEPPLDWPWYGIRFVDGIKRGFRKYATFTGRASASEFWWFNLFSLIVFFGLFLLAAPAASNRALGTFIAFVILLAWSGLVVPTIAVTVRRLHDTGRSGLNYLWTFVPFVGGIILLILVLGATTPSAERYGPPFVSQYRH